ncbi:MAG TPA: nucleoid occlusion factor SlmA [Porticoccaceae bacterium]|nr:nucleoid occlusion factor SlmA [Porticoccaceae bacterium]
MARRKASRREQILAALAELLETAPHERITTAALAKHLGVSEAALYRHFPSKARMYEGLLEFVEDTIFTNVRAVLNTEPTIEAQCQGILTVFLTFCEKNPGITRILIGDALVGESERLHTRAAQILERLETQLKQAFREASVRERKLTMLSVAETSEMLVAMVEGKVRLFVRSGFKRLPSTHWPAQWRYLSSQLIR